MKPFKKIILIVLFSFILIRFAGIVLDKGFTNYYEPFFEKMNHVFETTHKNDIIYLGNSRANFGINPYFIDSICNTKSYNLGFGGSDIAGAIALLQSYLIHHPAPKYLVYSYDHRLFQLRKTLELAPVYFYYTKYKPVRDELQRFGYREKFLQYLPALKYCFFNDYYRTCIVKGLSGSTMSDPVKRKGVTKYLYDYRGYINYQTKGLITEEPADTSIPQISSACLKMFTSLVNLCKKNNTKLIFIYPSEYYKPGKIISKERLNRKTIIDSMLVDVCKKNNFYYKRFDTNDFTRADFTDPEHVNIYGSKKYSVMLGNYLKSIIN